ncbi:MAG TPA: serine/threonine protein kinase [Nannocystis exedens]|nr:serine/threonine protein kinase [Nannocystis exedens]
MKTLFSIGLPPQTAGPEAWIGRLIDGRYRVLELLAEGGMGAVFIAEHTGLGKRVALKLVRPEFTSDQVFVDRFHREAMATAHLDHPNIAKAIDYGTLGNGDAYLVMQLIRGRSLGDVIASGKSLPWRRVCELGAQIASALAAAHEIGIVHRDLKPDNVIIEGFDSQSPQAKVLDFGVARIQDVRALGVPDRELTGLGSVIGTPGYMAPEQACGGIATASCDLYSLGVILWELLAGRSLWQAETLTDLFTAQLTEDPPSPTVPEPLPAALEVLILQLLDREPTRRPASARDLGEVFREFAVAQESKLQRNNSDSDSTSETRAHRRRWQLGLLAATAIALATYLVIAAS